MKYKCKIKMLDGSRFEFETNTDKTELTPDRMFIIVQNEEDKKLFLNARHVVYISFKKGE